MNMECRLANKGDLENQKIIWKEAFGDEDRYIEYYYAHRYREEETALLISNEEIAAMLAMMPVSIIMPDGKKTDCAMLYAIATLPRYQHQGYASLLMEYSSRHLQTKNRFVSLLVPAEESLFDFYLKRGYQNGFSVREANVTCDEVAALCEVQSALCRMEPADPQEYNRRRNYFLTGRKYVAYPDNDISYQKKLSQLSGEDIYTFDINGEKGCVIVERISSERVMIKEMLLSEEHTADAMKHIVRVIKAQEYVLRTPEFIRHPFGGDVRPFGMVKGDETLLSEYQPKEPGYLGIAFD